MRYGKHKESEKITEEEVKEAIKRFEENGGLIRQLPEEPTPRLNLVGKKYAVYERFPMENNGSSQEYFP